MLPLVCCSLASGVGGGQRNLHSAQPVLRALRGGATAGGILWVRAPQDDNGASGSLQLVRSLAAFCEEHGLDEAEMLAVSKGEAKDHNGWTCGEAVEYDTPVAAEAEVL